jgi:hypothetical protein
MEPCSTYKPWHNKQTGKTYLVPDDGKCLHYYFYFVDEDLGLCHARVPTWLPCRLQMSIAKLHATGAPTLSATGQRVTLPPNKHRHPVTSMQNASQATR